MPARQAYVAELVGRPLLRNAVALSNAGMNFNRVVGPSVAGALLAVPSIGVGGVFAAMTAMYALVVVSLLRLPDRGEGASDDRAPAPADTAAPAADTATPTADRSVPAADVLG